MSNILLIVVCPYCEYSRFFNVVDFHTAEEEIYCQSCKGVFIGTLKIEVEELLG